MIKRTIISMIKIYQAVFARFLGRNCRFYPSCSEYAMESIEKHNIFKACVRILWRILRCNPFCAGGYDPVK